MGNSCYFVCIFRNREDLAKLVTGLETGTGMKLDKQESSDQSGDVDY
jgi:hypothetical protein